MAFLFFSLSFFRHIFLLLSLYHIMKPFRLPFLSLVKIPSLLKQHFYHLSLVKDS